MVREASGAELPELSAVYRSTLPTTFGYLLLHSGDRAVAEDLTAETYLNAVERFRQGRGHEVNVAWLKTVAKRRLIDHWRRQRARRERAVRLRNEVVARARTAPTTDADRQNVQTALSKLGRDHRLVLLLRHFDGLSIREIGVHMGRIEKAAESLLARAREAFRSSYGDGNIA